MDIIHERSALFMEMVFSEYAADLDTRAWRKPPLGTRHQIWKIATLPECFLILQLDHRRCWVLKLCHKQTRALDILARVRGRSLLLPHCGMYSQSD